jgi:hypothetical protein
MATELIVIPTLAFLKKNVFVVKIQSEDFSYRTGTANRTVFLKSLLYIMTGIENSVAEPDPGSGAFLTPGSGFRIRFYGSRIPNHIFESLVTIFLVKSSIIV